MAVDFHKVTSHEKPQRQSQPFPSILDFIGGRSNLWTTDSNPDCLCSYLGDVDGSVSRFSRQEGVEASFFNNSSNYHSSGVCFSDDDGVGRAGG